MVSRAISPALEPEIRRFTYRISADPSAIGDLYDELIAITNGNSKFEAFSDDQVLAAYKALASNGASAVESFRTTDELGRKYLYGDLGKSISSLSMI